MSDVYEVKDYTSDSDSEGYNCHYNGVKSTYGKRVESQFKMQPKYAEPGEASLDGNMKGDKRNEQSGP